MAKYDEKNLRHDIIEWSARLAAVLSDGAGLASAAIDAGLEDELPHDMVEHAIECTAILAAPLATGIEGPLMALSLSAHFIHELALAIEATEDDGEPAEATANSDGGNTVQ